MSLSAWGLQSLRRSSYDRSLVPGSSKTLAQHSHIQIDLPSGRIARFSFAQLLSGSLSLRSCLNSIAVLLALLAVAVRIRKHTLDLVELGHGAFDVEFVDRRLRLKCPRS
eukprot:scaffold47730_cov64-Phaeocystis_antarctica.AAC.2